MNVDLVLLETQFPVYRQMSTRPIGSVDDNFGLQECTKVYVHINITVLVKDSC